MQVSRLFGDCIRDGYEAFVQWRKYSNSWKSADRYRQKIVDSKSNPFVGNKIIKRAKDDSIARFGDSRHWHWLALYAELAEEYKDGWLPNGLYTYRLIPYLNSRRLAYVSTIKSLDHRIFKFATAPIAVVVKGSCYSSDGLPLTQKEFKKVMIGYNDEVVLKQDAAPSGEGIEFKRSSDVDINDFAPNKSYLVQPLFKQHRSLAEVYSNSVNTIRISTYLDNQGQVSVKHSLLRVGHSGSRIVNWGDRDIDLYIDRSGCVIEDAQDGIGRKIENFHPDNGFPFRELVVPSMEEARKACLRAHYCFPYLRYIAWDVYIDEHSIPRMIEWNAVNPSFWVHEARLGPLWSQGEIDEVLKAERQ